MHNFKSTPDSLKQIFIAFGRKPSLGAPVFNAASKDKDLWKFCLYSYKVRLKVLNLKLRSSERFKDSLSTKTLCMWSYKAVI